VNLPADEAAADEPEPVPAACAGMTPPSQDGNGGDEKNHASIRLDQPADGTELAVDEHGEITISGVLHKQATMVDVSVGSKTATDFTVGPPPEDEAAWASSWQAALRPPELGENLLCTRAERDPKRYARILGSITVVDLLPPSDVPGLAVDAVTDTTAKISWGEATDNYGLAGYDVSVDGGEPRRTTVGTRSHSITGLEPESSHTVSVVAVDLAGNVSEQPATVSFTTKATPEPPDPKGELKIAPEQGAATATWSPKSVAEGTRYRVSLDGEEMEEFELGQYCKDVEGEPADPCTADSTVSYPVVPLEDATAYTLKVDEVAADDSVARTLTADFTTKAVKPEVDPAATERTASESSQCAGQGGDFYIAADGRGIVTVPAGSTELFTGCYTAADSSCVDNHLPPPDTEVFSCSDDVTALLRSVAPSGGGPVVASVDDTDKVQAYEWCAEGACALVLTPVRTVAPTVAKQTLARAVVYWLVAAASGTTIGIGVALGTLLALLFPDTIGVGGLLEYPIDYTTDFEAYDNWGLSEGEFFNSLQIYNEVIDSTLDLSIRHDLLYGWDSIRDSELKATIDHACAAQQGNVGGLAGCDEDVAVYVPGAKAYNLRAMPETGQHIVDAMTNLSSRPYPGLAREAWHYPAYSQGGAKAEANGFSRSWYYSPVKNPGSSCLGRQKGDPTVCDEFPFYSTDQAANLSGTMADTKLVPDTEASPQGNDIQQFLTNCGIEDGGRYIVLPLKHWVEANGPSFGFKISGGGTSPCMTPHAP
jgi:chitodextrinase